MKLKDKQDIYPYEVPGCFLELIKKEENRMMKMLKWA